MPPWRARLPGGFKKPPDRLVGLGNIALQHPELSVRQLTYAVKELGLRGVEISSAVNGLELADPQFETFWAKVEELGVMVFLHPLGSSLGPRLNQHYLSNIVGQPVENAIALSHLIFGGALADAIRKAGRYRKAFSIASSPA